MEALFVGYVTASVFACLPFIYWVTAPDWHKTMMGRSFMMLLSSMAITLVMIATTGIFGEYAFRELVRYIVYSSLLVAGVRLAILLMQLRFGPSQGFWVDDKPSN